jgi:uncharacterized glyoxalase superfamily protein PhnB
MRENRSMPQCAVIPELAYCDIEEAIGWLCNAFGFSLRLRIGAHRAQLNIGDGAVVLTKLQAAGESPMPEIPPTHAVMVRIEGVDSHCKQAAQAGAHILRSPADFPYGERQYSARDIAGHIWTFSQTLADVAPEDWGGVTGRL